MKEEKRFVPVMLTPFSEDSSIDFDGLTQLIHFYLKNGAKGLFANCQSSEMFDLTPEERLQIISHTIKVVDGKIPVVAAGNFGDTIKHQSEFIKKVYNLGVNAVIILTGLLAAENEDDKILEQRINDLLLLTEDIPLGFYECPLPYKRILSPQLLSKFVHTGRIIYHKDTCLNIEQVRLKNKLCEDKINFGLYDAYMAHAVESLKSGSQGLSCIQGNYFPELITWLCHNFNIPEQQNEVKLVQHFLIEEMDIMHDEYPKTAKYFLQQRGLPISTYTRNSCDSNLSKETKQKMNKLMARYNTLTKQISLTITGNKAEKI